MEQQKRVAIIGAGSSGLTAIKSCKEEGFIPVCYERNNEPGGLWRYHEEDINGVASVMRTTIINTSKEWSAFSDFPPPKEFPNFMHNSKMFEYFMMYAERFDLLKHIRYNLEVTKVEQTDDDTGRWTVSVKSTRTDAVTKETFDAVMVCIGHHVFPNIPTFPGQEKFRGTITHTHSLKSCDQFKGKRVVVVGIGNSGVDAAIDSTFVADQVYLSTRRGSWIFSRVGEYGLPYDVTFTSRKIEFLKNLFSFDYICTRFENTLNSKFDHEAYNLKPKHRVFSAHPTVNDALPNAILSGRVVIKRDIDTFVENGIIFEGEDAVTEIDAVILATGYQVKFPFLNNSVLKVEDNRVNLYKYSIPPQLKKKTLAIIGLIQPLGPIFPIAEMQCRWFMQIQAGNLKLPSVKEIEKEIALKNKANAIRYVDSPRHTIQVDFLPFLDEHAKMIGVKPNLWKMAITDPKLFWACLNGPALSYQYRLEGPHSWPGARNAILTVKERVLSPLNKNKSEISVKSKRFVTTKIILFIVAASAACIAVSKRHIDIYSLGRYLQSSVQSFIR